MFSIPPSPVPGDAVTQAAGPRSSGLKAAVADASRTSEWGPGASQGARRAPLHRPYPCRPHAACQHAVSGPFRCAVLCHIAA